MKDHASSYVVLMVLTVGGLLLLLLLLFCFGFYKAVQQSGVRIERCQEIRGHRVSGKYNGSLCRVNGQIVDVDYDDYRQQAANARGE